MASSAVSVSSDQTCEQDAEHCRFFSYLNTEADESGHRNVMVLESLCTVHARSGTTAPTLATRKAGETAAATPAVLSSALERAKTHQQQQQAGGTGPTNAVRLAPAYTGPPAKSMASTSRLRYKGDDVDRPLLPPLPEPAAPPERDENAPDALKQLLDALSPGLGLCTEHLRAGGIYTIDGLLALEDDEWDTLVELCATLREPNLTKQEIGLLREKVTPRLIGR